MSAVDFTSSQFGDRVYVVRSGNHTITRLDDSGATVNAITGGAFVDEAMVVTPARVKGQGETARNPVLTFKSGGQSALQDYTNVPAFTTLEEAQFVVSQGQADSDLYAQFASMPTDRLRRLLQYEQDAQATDAAPVTASKKAAAPVAQSGEAS
jgi:hypothetical protein